MVVCFYCNKNIETPCFTIAACSSNGKEMKGLIYTHISCFHEMAGDELLSVLSSVIDSETVIAKKANEKEKVYQDSLTKDLK